MLRVNSYDIHKLGNYFLELNSYIADRYGDEYFVITEKERNYDKASIIKFASNELQVIDSNMDNIQDILDKHKHSILKNKDALIAVTKALYRIR